MSTRRERLENKQEKREEWAGKAKTRSDRHFNAARESTAMIPMGQPILVGHHSEKRHRAVLKRSDRNMQAGHETAELAKHHASRADGIASQLASSIFSDDVDAIEALETRIAEREAERARWKAYNVSCRKGKPDPTLLDDEQKEGLSSIVHHAPYQLHKNGAAPAYVSANLSGNIRSDRERIKTIRRRAERAQSAADAGGVLIKEDSAPAGSCGHGYCSVTFAEKPERETLQALKAADFSWFGGYWYGQTSKLPDSVRALGDQDQPDKTVEDYEPKHPARL